MDYLINEVLESELEIDDLRNADQARWLQESFNFLLGTQLKVDGDLGGTKGLTRHIITEFQKMARIPVTKRADHLTVKTLRSLRDLNRQLWLPFLDRLDYFDQNKSQLKSHHHEKIAYLMKRALYLWKKKKVDTILITGHASTEGSKRHNQALSQNRLEEVYRHLLTAWSSLQSQPVSEFPRIFSVPKIALGELHPIPQASRQENRRVEVLLINMNLGY